MANAIENTTEVNSMQARKKPEPHIRDKAKKYSDRALLILASIMEDDELSPDARVKAAKEMLDRAHGKPTQMLGNDPDAPLPGMGIIQIFAIPDNGRSQPHPDLVEAEKRHLKLVG